MSSNGVDQTLDESNTIPPVGLGPEIVATPITGIGIWQKAKRRKAGDSIVVTLTLGYPEETPVDLQDTLSKEFWIPEYQLVEGFDYHSLTEGEMKKYQMNRGALDRILREFGVTNEDSLEGLRVKFTSQPQYKDKSRLEIKAAYKAK